MNTKVRKGAFGAAGRGIFRIFPEGRHPQEKLQQRESLCTSARQAYRLSIARRLTETTPVARLQPVAPLTIIAIFAGIAEASALATLPFLSEHSQALYTWFLVGFPFFLTALFFITLNFNYKSFYKPDARQAAARRAKASREAFVERPVEANEPPGLDAPFTVTLSGPAAQQMIESQISHLLAQPASRENHWVFCNLDKRQCIRLSLSELPDEASTDVP